jgi:hypothetical protein
VREKITPIIIWGIFRTISSWRFFLFFLLNSERRREKMTKIIKIIILIKLFSEKKLFNIL